MKGFVVVTGGRYAGVGSTLSLLHATSDANRAHAEEMTRLAETLNQAHQKKQSAMAAKSQFLAVMSHEIRTPLNGVLGMAQAMERDELSARQRERLGVVRQAGETLLAILNDVLDLSKIEAGKLELEEAEFDIEALARGAHAAFAAFA